MGYTAGIDIGGTNIAAGIVKDGALLSQASLPANGNRNAEFTVSLAFSATKEACKKLGISTEEICGYGIGLPGSVTYDGKSTVFATNMKWEYVPFCDMLSSITGKPAYAGNDADCAVLGEAAAGAAIGKKSAVMLTLGTGVGTGIIINGEIFSACSLGGVEAGHMIIEAGGRKCFCGRRGCLEAYASATALISRTREEMIKHPNSLLNKVCPDISLADGKTAFDAALLGDMTAQEIIGEYTSYLAIGIANLTAIFRPETVIIGGGIARQGNHLLLPLNEKLRKVSYAEKYIEPVLAVCAVLGSDAGILGAGVLFDSALRRGLI